MTSSETRLHSVEGTVGFEMVGNLFVNLAFKDLRKAGKDRYRFVTVWVQVESMASHREMLIEILNYSGFVGCNSVS